MAKAIHWPQAFGDIVAREQAFGDGQTYCALRPGTLYFEHRYWVEGDIVDVRVNHDVVGQATIVGDMTCCAIKDLTPADLERHKPGLQNAQAIIEHLNERYQLSLSPDSPVSVVYYRYLPPEGQPD